MPVCYLYTTYTHTGPGLHGAAGRGVGGRGVGELQAKQRLGDRGPLSGNVQVHARVPHLQPPQRQVRPRCAFSAPFIQRQYLPLCLRVQQPVPSTDWSVSWCNAWKQHRLSSFQDHVASASALCQFSNPPPVSAECCCCCCSHSQMYLALPLPSKKTRPAEVSSCYASEFNSIVEIRLIVLLHRCT